MDLQAEICARIASLHGARATWLRAASHAPAALASLGVVRPSDRLVVCADDFEPAFRDCFGGYDLRFISRPDAAEFAREGVPACGDASGCGDVPACGRGGVCEDESACGCGGAHESAPLDAPRVLWVVNSIGCRGLRVPNLRELAAAARAAGAVLVVDNTVASAFGCRPLELGAMVCLEALDRVGGGALAGKYVAVSVARSVRGRGRRQQVDPVAEALFEQLDGSMTASAKFVAGAVGTVDDAAVGAVDDADTYLHDLEVLAHALDTFEARMQRHMDNARAVAEYLAAHPALDGVAYPGLRSHVDHAVVAGTLLHGAGPAIDWLLPERWHVSAGEFMRGCACAGRDLPAGGRGTRLSPRDGADGRAVRIFVGTDDPLAVIDDLDRAIRKCESRSAGSCARK